MSQGLLDAVVESLRDAGASDEAVAAAVGAFGAWENAHGAPTDGRAST
jgi:hypothetical protein